MDDTAAVRRPADASDLRRGRLRRMQLVATGLLAVMAAVFFAASLAPSRWPAIGYLRAFAEAALVGGCADWFAVTALFRRPLGLPIPHTAIVPRNKDRIGESLGRFIVDNFLSARVLDAKLRDLELARWGGEWLTRPENARLIANRIVVWGPELVRALPAGAFEDLAQSTTLAAVRAVPAAPAASKLLAALWSEGRAQPIVVAVAGRLADYLSAHQDVILEKVQAQSWSWLPGWIDRLIAKKITDGVLQLLADLAEPDHPWRQRLAAEVEGLIARLAEDPAMREGGERLKLKLLENPEVIGHARELWTDMARRLAGGWTERSGELEGRLAALVGDLGAWLRDDSAVQRTLNTGARALARKVLAPRRQEIGRFIAQVVAGWDTRSVVDRLEQQMGADLQYIRVNGTLVGGLVGLTLFAIVKLGGLA
jgi:uncharacterized membrane-anchored protein YjiN (DUF445 family)